MNKKATLTVSFTAPVMNVKEYIDFSKYILFELRAFDPFFSKYRYWDENSNRTEKFDEDLSNFQPIVFDQLYDSEIAYINDDSTDKEYKLTSKNPFGFNNIYIPDVATESNLNISINIAEDKSSYSFINIEISDIGLESFYNSNNYIDLFKKMITLVDAKYGAIIPNALFKFISYRKNSDNKIGLATYFNDKNISQYISDNFFTEEFNGGVIFSVLKDLTKDLDEGLIHEINQIKESLYPTGVLNGNP